ncbi:hypothetical protein LEP1GSC072_2522 [Leptospira noguchii str. Bonito]|nr:hypothetical protein LEP1GSC072_2522 [Leptospira noguchii str. Bonito]
MGRSTGRVGNSTQRFPELSVSLLRSLDRSRWKLSTTLSSTQRLTPHGSLDRSRWKLNTTLSMGRVGNSTQRSLWVALETQHNALYGSRCGWELVLQRICRNSHRFNIEIQILVGLVMIVSVLLSSFIDPFCVT